MVAVRQIMFALPSVRGLPGWPVLYPPAMAPTMR
jgi:hypothetical protein